MNLTWLQPPAFHTGQEPALQLVVDCGFVLASHFPLPPLHSTVRSLFPFPQETEHWGITTACYVGITTIYKDFRTNIEVSSTPKDTSRMAKILSAFPSKGWQWRVFRYTKIFDKNNLMFVVSPIPLSTKQILPESNLQPSTQDKDQHYSLTCPVVWFSRDTFLFLRCIPLCVLFFHFHKKLNTME